MYRVVSDLAATGEDLAVGSVHGYHEVCKRSVGRLDITFDFAAFIEDQALMPLHKIAGDPRVLGPGIEPAFCVSITRSPPAAPASVAAKR